ncbi:hypothetical protein ABPG75_011051 [Micractinium tetrahymenae]
MLRSSWTGPGGAQLRRQAVHAGPAAQQQGRSGRLLVVAELGRSSGGSSDGSGRHGGRRRKARMPGLFEVHDVSPPPRSLGIHALPPNTHNGDQIEVEGSAFVVQAVVMQYKLVRGKYRRDHARLEVQNTGRMLANLYLEEMYRMGDPSGPADGTRAGS